MLKEGKFGPSEAICLLTITISSKVFFSSPAILVGLTGTAAWYTTLISATVALIGFYFIYLLLKRYPGQDLVGILDLTLGRIIGFVFSFLLAVYLLFVAMARISELTEFLKVYIILLSPNWFIVGIFILCLLTLSFLGLESIARIAKLLAFPLGAGLIAVLLLGVQNYDFNNLFPILGKGLDKIALHGILRSSVYGEVIILAIFASSFQGPKFIKKEGIISLVLSAIIISVSILAFLLTFPYYISEEITAPMYELSSLVDYGRFVQRIESVFLFVWVIASFISAGLVFYAFIWMFCTTFRIPDKTPIVIGSCLILFSLSLMHRDIVTVVFGYVKFIRNVGGIPLVILPALLLVISWVRRKGVKSNA